MRMEFLHRFRHHQQGNVLMLTGLAILFLVALGGAGVDFGRQQLVRSRLQQATDAAAIAAAALPDSATPAQRQNAALRVYQMNFPVNYLGVSRPTPQITTSGNITVEANGEVATNFVSNVGTNALNAQGRTVVASGTTSSSSNYDIIMALDISSSMTSEDVGSAGVRPVAANLRNRARALGIEYCTLFNQYTNNFYRLGCNQPVDFYGLRRDTRLNAMRNAAYRLADRVLEQSNVSRIALVQWSTLVFGNLAYSNDRDAVLRAIDLMPAFGGTNSARALRYASEELVDETRDNSIPVLLLLTDGYNYEPFYGPRLDIQNGHRDRIDAETLASCRELKSRRKPVVIYTVGFGQEVLEDPIATNLLRSCATQPEYYLQAENAEQLQQAFDTIFTSVKKLRLIE